MNCPRTPGFIKVQKGCVIPALNTKGDPAQQCLLSPLLAWLFLSRLNCTDWPAARLHFFMALGMPDSSRILRSYHGPCLCCGRIAVLVCTHRLSHYSPIHKSSLSYIFYRKPSMEAHGLSDDLMSFCLPGEASVSFPDGITQSATQPVSLTSGRS